MASARDLRLWEVAARHIGVAARRNREAALNAVTVDGIQLDVVRESDGTLRILGRGLDEFPRHDPDQPLPSGELRVRESRILITDRAVAGDGESEVVWNLEAVNLSLVNRRDGFRVSGDFVDVDDVIGGIAPAGAQSQPPHAAETVDANAKRHGSDLPVRWS